MTDSKVEFASILVILLFFVTNGCLHFVQAYDLSQSNQQLWIGHLVVGLLLVLVGSALTYGTTHGAAMVFLMLMQLVSACLHIERIHVKRQKGDIDWVSVTGLILSLFHAVGQGGLLFGRRMGRAQMQKQNMAFLAKARQQE